MSGDSPPGPYLLFELAAAARAALNLWGLDVRHVLQVLEIGAVVPVPLAPPEVQGIVNHHGRIITVFDPAPLFGMQAQPPPPQQVIVLRRGSAVGGNLGLTIARPQDIVAADRLERTEVPGGPCVGGVMRREHDLVHLVSYDDLHEALNRRFGAAPAAKE